MGKVNLDTPVPILGRKADPKIVIDVGQGGLKIAIDAGISPESMFTAAAYLTRTGNAILDALAAQQGGSNGKP